MSTAIAKNKIKNKIKNKKSKLYKDTVMSQSFHVGIELELIAANDEDGEREHDYDSCSSAGEENYRDYLESMGAEGFLRDRVGLTISDARTIAHHYNLQAAIDTEMSQYDHECEGDCGYYTGGVDSELIRNELTKKLRGMTGNASFKVVNDSSLDLDEDKECAAEVCWNYFAHKETITDNTKNF